METYILNYILTAISSIVAFALSKKYLWKYIINFFKWLLNIKKDFDKKNVDASKELLTIKDKNNDVYENQIQFLTDQIKVFEERINFKQQELNKYLDELQELREKIIQMQKQIYDNRLKIVHLQSLCCSNLECKLRCKCNIE